MPYDPPRVAEVEPEGAGEAVARLLRFRQAIGNHRSSREASGEPSRGDAEGLLAIPGPRTADARLGRHRAELLGEIAQDAVAPRGIAHGPRQQAFRESGRRGDHGCSRIVSSPVERLRRATWVARS